jgi:tetratricopeptide (TPR) repeat protein
MASEPPKVFISYNRADRDWAEWIAASIEWAGYRPVIQAWDFRPGENFVLRMQQAAAEADITLPVLSEAYLKSEYTQPEWAAAFAQDPMGKKRRLIPVRVAECTLTGMLSTIIYIDLAGLGEEDAQRALFDGLKPSGRPARTPAFPRQQTTSGVSPVPFPPNAAKPDKSALGAAAYQSALSNIPDRNPFFTGREQVLTQLREALARQGRAALSGLGGVGKTQTAVEYAHRHLDQYLYTFWVTAASREAIVSGDVTIAGLLKLPESTAKDQTLAVDAVMRWLTSHRGWLLILDNADDLAMVREFIPSGKNGHLLLTTRARAVGAIARLVEMQDMDTDEGALFLLRRAKYIAEDAFLETAIEVDQAIANEITAQLDGLPLALDQAATYIEETSCGLSGYLELYRKHAPDLLQLRGTLGPGHPDPVASTWALSFEKIEKACREAAELLKFCAFLHPDAIPEEVFYEGATELGSVLGVIALDQLALNHAISEILKYSLVRRDPSANTLEIHRLVQFVLKQGMDEAAQRLWADRAVRALNCAFPSVEFSSWADCERLLPQVSACAELIDQWRLEFPEAARLLNNGGSYLYQRGRYAAVGPLYQRALTIREKVLGPEHPDVATSLNNLALLYDVQGQYAKSDPLCQRALAIREKVLGPEHPDTAASLNNLADLYRAHGQYTKSEPLYQRALAIREKALGTEHPDTAISLGSLAGLYNAQGEYAKAEPLYQRALAICEKALGPAHPDVANSLNNLAGFYLAQREYAKSEPLYQRALAIREKTLGQEHPNVATSLNDLALLYHAQSQYSKAEPLYQRALAIWENVMGPEHLEVATSLHNLAGLCASQGQYAKAEPLYQRALAIRGNVLGLEHSDVAVSLENYAFLLRSMGRPDEASVLESRARAIWTKTLN